MKSLTIWLAALALFSLLGCSKGGDDMNKGLKPLTGNQEKPQAIKDKSKLDSGQVMK